MVAIEGKKIAVVGGGPGGLTLARLLQLRGADVSVFERDLNRQARVTGSALDLHEDSGLAALHEAGLMDGFWKLYRPELDRLRLVNERAEVLYDFKRGLKDGVQRPEIERAPLRNLLLDSLLPETVQWNKKLESATVQDGKVHLTFADGTGAEADLAIGADGAHSRLRRVVTESKPFYVGITLLEGTVPNAAAAVPKIWDLVGGSAVMALGAGQTLAMATKSDGSLLFYAGRRAPLGYADDVTAGDVDETERLKWFKANFGAWSAAWEPLFAHATALASRPLFVCPDDQMWEAHPQVTLLGDAAHVMPPYAGEGVNMAMQDALVLSRQLCDEQDVTTAIAGYQEEMFARTGAISARTMENTERFYAPDASRQVVRMFQEFADQIAAERIAASLRTEPS